jgi:hypothetical protein
MTSPRKLQKSDYRRGLLRTCWRAAHMFKTTLRRLIDQLWLVRENSPAIKSYQGRLHELLESQHTASKLALLYETVTGYANRGDYQRASATALEGSSNSLEYFGDAHAIAHLWQFYYCDILAQDRMIEQAVVQFQQVMNALIFTISSRRPEGSEAAADLVALFVETALADRMLRKVIIQFDKDEGNLQAIGNVAAFLHK